MLHFEYGDEKLFTNSIIIINYRFKNAIYYKFGKHRTVENKIKLFNLSKIKPEIGLTVYGFFRKEYYLIKLKPENVLINKSFKTEFLNLNLELISKVLPEKYSNDFLLDVKTIDIELPEIATNFKPIQLNHNSFNKTDFL